MDKQLALQKETIHRLGGSSLASAQARDASRGSREPGKDLVSSSIFITTTITW